MALLADAIAKINNAFKDTFHHKPHDPEPGRKKAVRVIEKAVEQYQAGRTRVPRRTWEIGHGAVSFSLKLNGQVVPLNGEDVNYIAADEFVPFLEVLREAVPAGELDKEIDAALAAGSPIRSSRVVVEPGKPKADKPLTAGAHLARVSCPRTRMACPTA